MSSGAPSRPGSARPASSSRAFYAQAHEHPDAPSSARLLSSRAVSENLRKQLLQADAVQKYGHSNVQRPPFKVTARAERRPSSSSSSITTTPAAPCDAAACPPSSSEASPATQLMQHGKPFHVSKYRSTILDAQVAGSKCPGSGHMEPFVPTRPLKKMLRLSDEEVEEHALHEQSRGDQLKLVYGGPHARPSLPASYTDVFTKEELAEFEAQDRPVTAEREQRIRQAYRHTDRLLKARR